MFNASYRQTSPKIKPLTTGDTDGVPNPKGNYWVSVPGTARSSKGKREWSPLVDLTNGRGSVRRRKRTRHIIINLV